MSDLRAEYFTANPDSPYGSNVTGATIVPGMGRFDVLAAWGHPARRVRSVGLEQWTYFDVDTDSGDAMEYALVFQEGVLDRWTTHTHKNTGVAYKGRDETPARVNTSDPPGGKKVPKS